MHRKSDFSTFSNPPSVDFNSICDSKYEFLTESSAFLIFFLLLSFTSSDEGFLFKFTYEFLFFEANKRAKQLWKNDSIHKTFRIAIRWAAATEQKNSLSFFFTEHVFWIFFIFYSPSTFPTTPQRCQKNIINYIHLLFRAIWKKNSRNIKFYSDSLFAFLSPCAAVACLLLCCRESSFSLTVKGEYNRRLFTYLCLFLFVFNYRVMSRGLER